MTWRHVIGVLFVSAKLFGSSLPCVDLLQGLIPESSTARFIRLLQHLSLEKGVIDENQLESISQSENPFNPLVEEKHETRSYVYFRTFEDILSEKEIHWDRVKTAAQVLALQKRESLRRKEKGDEKAKPIFFPSSLDRKEFEDAREVTHTWEKQNGGLGMVIGQKIKFRIIDTRGHTYLEFTGRPHRRYYESPWGDLFALTREKELINLSSGESLSENIPEGTSTYRSHPVLLSDGTIGFLADRGTLVYSDYRPNRQLSKRFDPDVTYYVSPDWKNIYRAEVDRIEGRQVFFVYDALKGEKIFESETDSITGFDEWFDSKGNLYVKCGTSFFNVIRKKSFKVIGKSDFLETAKGSFLASIGKGVIELLDIETDTRTRLKLPMDTPHSLFLRELPDERLVAILQREELLLVDFSSQSIQQFPFKGKSIYDITRKGPPIGVMRDQNKIRLIQFFGPVL